MIRTDDDDLEGDERLARARAGSHTAFRALVEPHQAELRRHCYRMTGSLDDADDIVQETLFRAWRGLGTYVSRGSFRAWLYRIATHRSLDLLKSAPRRHDVFNSANEPPWLQPFPLAATDAGPDDDIVERETIGLAFVAALQNLPGRQRSVLILRDVLGFSAAETAGILECTTAAANSALQRARSTMAALDPAPDAPRPTDDEQELVARRFLAAWQAGDTDGLVGLLHATVHMTMPPHPLEVFGAIETADLLLRVAPGVPRTRLRFLSVSANGERGVAAYVPDDETGRMTPHCLAFLGPAAGGVRKITGFTEPRIFELLDLPATLDADDPVAG